MVVATARRTMAVVVLSRLVACCGIAALLVMIAGAAFGFRGISIAIWPILSGFMLSVCGYVVYREGVDDEDRLYNLESFLCDIVYLLTSVVTFAFSGLPWAWAGTLAAIGIGVLGLLFLRSNSIKLVYISLVLLGVALVASLVTIPLVIIKAQPTAMPAVTFSALLLPLVAYGWVVRWRFLTEMCADA